MSDQVVVDRFAGVARLGLLALDAARWPQKMARAVGTESAAVRRSQLRKLVDRALQARRAADHPPPIDRKSLNKGGSNTSKAVRWLS